MTDRPMTACTHSGTFHADDVFATALLKLHFDSGLVIRRSRDPEVIAAADIVFDVGGICDPKMLRFDHHMADFPRRKDGRPFSSVGLIWEHYGTQILWKVTGLSPIKDLQDIAAQIDQEFILPIDLIDNGVTAPGATDVTVAVDHFNPNWTEASSDDDVDAAFFRAVDFARSMLLRIFAAKLAEYRAETEIHDAAMRTEDPRLIELPRSVPFRNAVHRLQLTELLYVVSPSGNKGNWGLTAVSVEPNSFVNRKDLPAAWAGLTDAELQTVTGVDDAVFAHRSRFFAVARSRAGALKLAESALSAD